jgi:hypothetical protein
MLRGIKVLWLRGLLVSPSVRTSRRPVRIPAPRTGTHRNLTQWLIRQAGYDRIAATIREAEYGNACSLHSCASHQRCEQNDFDRGLASLDSRYR